MASTIDDPTPLDTRPVLLPEGTRLVHIGPHKTGTTSVQAAMFAARAAMSSQGVRYAGRTRHPASAVLAAIGRGQPGPGGGPPPPIGLWKDLVRDVTGARESRVVVSSEFFSDAGPEAIDRILAALDVHRVHVVVSLRPLPLILASQWQQYVQAGMRASYDRWLHAMLDEEETTLSPTFWVRHRHDRLIQRWADAVGRDRVSVIVADDRDHAFILRAFEALTGLREGTLVPILDAGNRSLTFPEIELIRACNRALHAEGQDRALQTKAIRYGVASYLKRQPPGANEPRVETPQWALDRAGAVALEMVTTIAGAGVRIIGELKSLSLVPTSGLDGDRQPSVSISPRLAAAGTMGVLTAFGLAGGVSASVDPDDDTVPDGGRLATVPRLAVESPELLGVSTEWLALALARRLRASAARRLPFRRRA